MDTKPRIKIIKRGEQPPKTATKAIKKKTAQTTAREMVATVTEWVNEFQQKQCAETQETLKKLFAQTPDPSKC